MSSNLRIVLTRAATGSASLGILCSLRPPLTLSRYCIPFPCGTTPSLQEYRGRTCHVTPILPDPDMVTTLATSQPAHMKSEETRWCESHQLHVIMSFLILCIQTVNPLSTIPPPTHTHTHGASYSSNIPGNKLINNTSAHIKRHSTKLPSSLLLCIPSHSPCTLSPSLSLTLSPSAAQHCTTSNPATSPSVHRNPLTAQCIAWRRRQGPGPENQVWMQPARKHTPGNSEDETSRRPAGRGGGGGGGYRSSYQGPTA